MNNQQIERLEIVASVLEAIPETFVFTGGATIALYVDEIVGADLRPTDDVDCVVEITSKGQYYQLAEKLRNNGLQESTQQGAPLCRWQYQEINIDIMPSEEKVLGFSNRWYPPGISSSIPYQLPSGRIIQIFTTAYLLASKIEAFLGRGKGSFYWSTDIEDIITLLDGCSSLESEINQADLEVKKFIQQWFQQELENLQEIVPASLSSVAVNSGRVQLLNDLIQRLAN